MHAWLQCLLSFRTLSLYPSSFSIMVTARSLFLRHMHLCYHQQQQRTQRKYTTAKKKNKKPQIHGPDHCWITFLIMVYLFDTPPETGGRSCPFSFANKHTTPIAICILVLCHLEVIRWSVQMKDDCQLDISLLSFSLDNFEVDWGGRGETILLHSPVLLLRVLSPVSLHLPSALTV